MKILDALEAYLTISRLIFQKAFGNNIPIPERINYEDESSEIYENENVKIQLYDDTYNGMAIFILNDPYKRSAELKITNNEIHFILSIVVDFHSYESDYTTKNLYPDNDFYAILQDDVIPELFRNYHRD